MLLAVAFAIWILSLPTGRVSSKDVSVVGDGKTLEDIKIHEMLINNSEKKSEVDKVTEVTKEIEATKTIESISRVEIEKDFERQILIENLDTPWSIDFLPDDRMIFTERPGRVSIYDKGITKVIAELDVDEKSEAGLLGIAVDPDFNNNNYVYLYYTRNGGNRVSRFEVNTIDDGLEKEVIILDEIPSARFHDGGRIKFGSDDKLYITTGDAVIPSSSQDINSLAGKILRINKDGSIPEDNPFGNFVYSLGHRNPQGIVWHPTSGELYSSEHGPTRNDEINIIEKGKNYGWPTVECDDVSQEYENSIRCFSDFTLAPSSIAFYGGDLYVSGLRGEQLRRFVLDTDGRTLLFEEELFADLGRIRDVVYYDGFLYIATSNLDGRGIPRVGDDKIIRARIISG